MAKDKISLTGERMNLLLPKDYKGTKLSEMRDHLGMDDWSEVTRYALEELYNRIKTPRTSLPETTEAWGFPGYKPDRLIENINLGFGWVMAEPSPVIFLIPDLSLWGHVDNHARHIAGRILDKRPTIIITAVQNTRKYEPLVSQFMADVFDHLIVQLDIPLIIEEIAPYFSVLQLEESMNVSVSHVAVFTHDWFLQQVVTPFALSQLAHVYLSEGEGSGLFMQATNAVHTVLPNLSGEGVRDGVRRYLSQYSPSE